MYNDMGGTKWVPVTLSTLSIMTNDQRPDSDNHWAAVQVEKMVVAGRPCLLVDPLHAHISLGKWHKNPTDWGKYLKRAKKRLQQCLEMEMIVDSFDDDGLLVFRFMIHSSGGTTLHALRQILSSEGMQVLQLKRMSGPGSVFHLSVYDYAKFFAARHPIGS